MQVASTTAIRSSSLTGASQNGISVRDQFTALEKALESGSLPQAKQIYTNLQKQGIGQKLAGQNSPVDLDFAALGKALGSGDLAGARQAYALLKTDYQYSAIASKIQQVQAQAQSSIATHSPPTSSTSTNTTIQGLVSASQLVK
jgi:outer membrane protein assembly factor BamD (BamD/ComL family)